MEQHISQGEIRRIIITDMVKKRNSIVPDFHSYIHERAMGYGLSLLSQYYNEQGRFLDDFMDFVSKNASCIKLKDEVLFTIIKRI